MKRPWWKTPDGMKRRRLHARSYRTRHPGAGKADKIKYHFGVSVVWFLAQFHFQQGRCAICRQAEVCERAISIDHCHVTSRVRGLLCIPCNTALVQVERVPGFNSRCRSYLDSVGWEEDEAIAESEAA